MHSELHNDPRNPHATHRSRPIRRPAAEVAANLPAGDSDPSLRSNQEFSSQAHSIAGRQDRTTAGPAPIRHHDPGDSKQRLEQRDAFEAERPPRFRHAGKPNGHQWPPAKPSEPINHRRRARTRLLPSLDRLEARQLLATSGAIGTPTAMASIDLQLRSGTTAAYRS